VHELPLPQIFTAIRERTRFEKGEAIPHAF
jgi:hypothetical protein